MPAEIAPGYTTCTHCGRLLATVDANSSGRCPDCAGKSKEQLAAEPEVDQKAANRTAREQLNDPVTPVGVMAPSQPSPSRPATTPSTGKE